MPKNKRSCWKGVVLLCSQYGVCDENFPDKLYTPKAKELAKKRVEFMKQFFERLKREINGEI